MRKFEYRKLLKNRGCYVEFEYDFQFTESMNCGVQLNYLADADWELACRMGLQIFKSYLFRKQSGYLELTVTKIKWLPIDTDDLIVMFGLIKALSESLNLEIAGLDLDVSREVFMIPESRSII